MVRRSKREVKKLQGGRLSELTTSTANKSYLRQELADDDQENLDIEDYFKLQLEKARIADFEFERYSRTSDDLLKALYPVLKKILLRLVHGKVCDVPIYDDIIDLYEADHKIMKPLIDFNWSYYVRTIDGTF